MKSSKVVYKAFVIHTEDNVAVVLQDVPQGKSIEIVGQTMLEPIVTQEEITLGHKIALQALPTDEPIIKYGVKIGKSTTDISIGAWVHLHNCTSSYDERSGTLDIHTGATSDTPYQ